MKYDLDVVCENCGHEGAKTRRFECHGEQLKGVFDRAERHYCNVCSATFLSAATNYPTQCPDVRLWKSIGWIANEILSRLPEKPSGNAVTTPTPPTKPNSADSDGIAAHGE